MKKIIIFALTTALFTAMSCTDNREDGYLVDRVYLVKAELQTYISTSNQTDTTATAWTVKGGLNGSTCTVTYALDATYLADYNQAYGTTYEMLPEACYTLKQTIFTLGKKEMRAEFAVNYNPAKILELGGNVSLKDKYALPIRITADGLDVVAQKDRVLMTFDVSIAE
ncbi:MAG: DUF1735 domain-containing protein [Alistipes sp.]